MDEHVVSVDGLVKRYGSATSSSSPAVDGITFDVNKGEIFALLGPNGAGKTTTIEILECIRTPTAGRVSVLGYSVSDSGGASEIKKRIGVLPQEFNTLGRLTVAENLEFFAGIYDNPVDPAGLLEMLGLKDKAKARFDDLSGGLKQRVGIAAALVNDPELLFLDEPTTGLDPEIRRATWGVIRDLRAKGKSIILTTHYMEEAEELADRIAILVKGKIAALDTTSQLIRASGIGRAMIFSGGGEGVFGTLRRFFDTVSMDGADVVVPFRDIRDVQVAVGALVERGLKPDLAIKSASIEDVFLKLAGFGITESGDAK